MNSDVFSASVISMQATEVVYMQRINPRKFDVLYKIATTFIVLDVGPENLMNFLMDIKGLLFPITIQFV